MQFFQLKIYKNGCCETKNDKLSKENERIEKFLYSTTM